MGCISRMRLGSECVYFGIEGLWPGQIWLTMGIMFMSVNGMLWSKRSVNGYQ